METILGVIGGSGLYDIEGLSKVESVEVNSPWGKTSAPLVVGELNGVKVVFLARHGKGHHIAPNDINYRANIDALKRVGVTDIISVSSCGSLREDMPPGMFVLVDQFIDHTSTRPRSFFGTGLVAHVSMANPTCNRLADQLEQVMRAEHMQMHNGGTYITIEGPHFSTYAESIMYRSWGCDLIGMTNMPEAKLAREAEMCYQTVAMVTDFDCWHKDHAAVDVDAIIARAHSNATQAKILIQKFTAKLAQQRPLCDRGCNTALDAALITAAAARSAETMTKLDAIMQRITTC